MIAAIVAVDNNWGIGYKGKLLESIPDDLKHFKELTTNNIIVMGRKTWDSLPHKPLPNRFNIIITHNPECFSSHENYIFLTLEDTLKLMRNTPDNKNIFIIGGGMIYEKLLSFCDRVYLTKIYKDYNNIDTYFPNLDKMEEWTLKNYSDICQYNELSYQFQEYDRIS